MSTGRRQLLGLADRLGALLIGVGGDSFSLHNGKALSPEADGPSTAQEATE